MASKPVTVSQLNEYISRVISTDPLLMNISVLGEISNLKYHSSGHVYFSLIDENAKINCFLPASRVRNLDRDIADGTEITVHGFVNIYKKGGAYSLYVRDLEATGAGALSSAFEILKEKLQNEGLFNREHKKALPEFPQKIALVTSDTGAAVEDMKKIITSRTKIVDIVVFPVSVQGVGAAGDMARTVKYISNSRDDIDVIIIGRGGGAAEDLNAFNEEILARAVYECKIPIISAVGHETDFSICDFVADVRAETPTAAAEMAVPTDSELLRKIEYYRSQLVSGLQDAVFYRRLKFIGIQDDIDSSFKTKVSEMIHAAQHNKLILEENNPTSVLSKGYAVIEGVSGVISSVKALKDGNKYKIYLKDGSVEAVLSLVREGEQNDI